MNVKKRKDQKTSKKEVTNVKGEQKIAEQENSKQYKQ